MIDLTLIQPTDWLAFNAKLQQKKSALRSELADLGFLKKGGTNKFDNYKYFTEAQYKDLFNNLLSKHNLELKFNEIEYALFEGTEKQANGRMPKVEFVLFDCETGFFEKTTITGEGIDKGDKAGYKAYTGALKYYLADTFMVPTGDDPEQESPVHKMNQKKEDSQQEQKVEDIHVNALRELLNQKGVKESAILKRYKLADLADMTMIDFLQCCNGLNEMENKA